MGPSNSTQHLFALRDILNIEMQTSELSPVLRKLVVDIAEISISELSGHIYSLQKCMVESVQVGKTLTAMINAAQSGPYQMVKEAVSANWDSESIEYMAIVYGDKILKLVDRVKSE